MRVGDDGIETAVSVSDWVKFDGSARRFRFRPHRSWHAGVHTLRVAGEDSGIGSDAGTKKRSHADFVLRVESVNDAPIASPLRGCGGFTVKGLYGRGDVFVGSCIQSIFAGFFLVVCWGGFVRGLSCVGAEFFRVGAFFRFEGFGSAEMGFFHARGGLSSRLDVGRQAICWLRF